jgi:hypothetical protein
MGPPPQVSQRGPCMERHPSQNLFSHVNPWRISPLPGFPARPHGKRCPSPEPSCMPPGSPNRTPIQRNIPFLEPSFHYFSQFLVNRPSPQVFQWDPYKEKHLSTEPSTSHPLKIHLSLRVPRKGAPFMFPIRSLWTEILLHQSQMEGLHTIGCGLVPQGDC